MPQPFSGLERSSGETQTVCRLITRFAFRRHPVVIMGESGTGKELAARAIRAEGPRRDRCFAAVDCGALTPTLVESEWFGIEGGLIQG
jgi:two-component system response regulator HydG